MLSGLIARQCLVQIVFCSTNVTMSVPDAVVQSESLDAAQADWDQQGSAQDQVLMASDEVVTSQEVDAPRALHCQIHEPCQDPQVGQYCLEQLGCWVLQFV